MTGAELNLVVLRSADIERSAKFYCALGISLARERHGSGPEHFAGLSGSVVLEIYPQKNGEEMAKTRIGFRVSSISEVIPLLEEADGVVVSDPQDSPWGRRAVIADPDGHRLELLEARPDEGESRG